MSTTITVTPPHVALRALVAAGAGVAAWFAFVVATGA